MVIHRHNLLDNIGSRPSANGGQALSGKQTNGRCAGAVGDYREGENRHRLNDRWRHHEKGCVKGELNRRRHSVVQRHEPDAELTNIIVGMGIQIMLVPQTMGLHQQEQCREQRKLCATTSHGRIMLCPCFRYNRAKLQKYSQPDQLTELCAQLLLNSVPASLSISPAIFSELRSEGSAYSTVDGHRRCAIFPSTSPWRYWW